MKETKSRLPIVAFMAGRFMDEMPRATSASRAYTGTLSRTTFETRASGC